MVHQHFMLIPVITVAENIVLAAEPTTGRCWTSGRRAAGSGALRPLRARGRSSGARARHRRRQQQRTEILKALYRHARVLILDEPTAVLTPQEARELFGVLDELRKGGTSVIMITHKLDEVLEVADRITRPAARQARRDLPRAEATERSLAELMVGREVLLQVERTPARPGDVVLQVDDLWVRDDRGLDAVRGMTFAAVGRARSWASPASTETGRPS